MIEEAAIELAHSPDFTLGHLCVQPSLRRLVHEDGREEILEPRVMQVLVALARKPGEILSRSDLSALCWNNRIVGEDAINRVISRLRRVTDGIGERSFRLETITKIGYRILELPSTAATDPDAPPGDRFPSRPALRRRPPRRWMWTIGAICAAIALLALVGAAIRFARPSAKEKGKHVLVENLRVDAGDAAAELLRQSLATDLARMVLGKDSSLDFADPGDRTGAGSVPVDYLLSGDAGSASGSLHATVRLVNAADRTILWSSDFSGAPGEVDALRQRIAGRVADVLICALGSRSARPANVDISTLRLFLAGCGSWHTDWPGARKYFGLVVERRPDFAQARALYAASLTLNTGTFSGVAKEDWDRLNREAIAQAKIALSQDRRLGNAYFVLAEALPARLSVARRIAILGKGVRADPDDGGLQTALAVELGNLGVMRDSITLMERAFALDPFSPLYASNLAEAYAYGGRYDEAVRLLDQARQFWPDEFYTGWIRFEVVARKGDPRAALAMLDDSARRSGYRPSRPDLWRVFLRARADPAERDRAVTTLAAAVPGADPQNRVDIIEDLIQLGRVDRAYDVVRATPVIPPEWNFSWFGDYMAPFRRDARFMPFLARQGIPPVWRTIGRRADFCAESGPPDPCPT